MYLVKKMGAEVGGGGVVGTIEGEREVSMRYILLSICGSYLWIEVGLHSVGRKTCIYVHV